MLFVLGPTATLQVALACMHWVAPAVADARDMGVALAAVKERLRGGCDAQRLVDICLHTVGHLSATQLAGWRNHCRRLVSEEHVRLDAKRRLVKLQHASGFSWQEVLLLARHCGLEPASPGVSGEGTDGAAILATTVELHAFERHELAVGCALTPNESGQPLDE